MERENNTKDTADANDQHGQGGPHVSTASGSRTVAESSSFAADDAQRVKRDNSMRASSSAGSERMEPFNNVPVFLDRTFRMIESVSDDIVCWSEGGDSFIIKQVRGSKKISTAKESVVFRYAVICCHIIHASDQTRAAIYSRQHLARQCLHTTPHSSSNHGCTQLATLSVVAVNGF